MENKRNGCRILTRVHVSGFYYTLSWSTVRIDLAWVNYVVISRSTYIYLKFLVKATNSYVAQSCDFSRRP